MCGGVVGIGANIFGMKFFFKALEFLHEAQIIENWWICYKNFKELFIK